MKTVSIYGIGRVGGALAIALDRAGYSIDHLISRNPAKAASIANRLASTTIVTETTPPDLASDILFITTIDPQIERAGKMLADTLLSNPIVFHTSGSIASDALESLNTQGKVTGSMHPLLSISDPIKGSESFSGSYFCLEGHPDAVREAKVIVNDLGAKSFSVSAENKALYHAAAVISAGHVVALFDLAVSLMEKSGAGELSKELLLPLISSTVANLQDQTAAEALTGTFARGDVAAFHRHIASLDRSASKDEKLIYILLAERSLALAESNGLDPAAVDELRNALSVAKCDLR